MQRRAALILVFITPALLITSCKASNKAKAPKPLTNLSPTAVASATTAPASASATPTAAPPPAATSAPASIPASGSPVNLDPCQLVTQNEAATLAGASFGPGKEETISASSRECVYGSQTTNVMDIVVAQADSPATAKAVYAQELGNAQNLIATELPPGVHVNLVTSSASLGSSSGQAQALRVSATKRRQ